jgi:hypothetical protein
MTHGPLSHSLPQGEGAKVKKKFKKVFVTLERVCDQSIIGSNGGPLRVLTPGGGAKLKKSSKKVRNHWKGLY